MIMSCCIAMELAGSRQERFTGSVGTYIPMLPALDYIAVSQRKL